MNEFFCMGCRMHKPLHLQNHEKKGKKQCIGCETAIKERKLKSQARG